jgi:hypothetical protein
MASILHQVLNLRIRLPSGSRIREAARIVQVLHHVARSISGFVHGDGRRASGVHRILGASRSKRISFATRARQT